MIVSNVSNTKNKLSELLQRVQQGEIVTIVDRDRPIARLIAIPEDDPVARLHRLASSGKVRIPAGFGEPWDLNPARPNTGEFVGALDALLAEREGEH